MPIYDKPVRLLMRDMVSDLNLQKGQVISKSEALSWFKKHYPKIKPGTVSAHLIRLSTNAPSRVHYHAESDQDDLFFQIDGSHFRLYDRVADPSPIRATLNASVETDIDLQSADTENADAEDAVEPTEFAYESDLRNFLAKHLEKIESGLRLYEDEGITGIEFPVGGRFIDILALDSKNDFVVIELKVSRGYDRVVGQLLRYMGWIKKKQAEPAQNVRGVIVARDISEDLQLACSEIPNVKLFEYQLEVSLKQVN